MWIDAPFTVNIWARPTATAALTTVTESASGTAGSSATRFLFEPMSDNSSSAAGLGFAVAANGVQVFARRPGVYAPVLVQQPVRTCSREGAENAGVSGRKGSHQKMCIKCLHLSMYALFGENLKEDGRFMASPCEKTKRRNKILLLLNRRKSQQNRTDLSMVT
jgi:hypothetical protein